MNHASYALCPRIRLPHMMNKVILRISGSKREGIMSYLQQTIKAVIRPGDEVRNGSGWLDSFVHFLSGASRVLPMRR